MFIDKQQSESFSFDQEHHPLYDGEELTTNDQKLNPSTQHISTEQVIFLGSTESQTK